MIQVKKATLSSGVLATLIELNGEEGMLSTDITRVLQIPHQTLSDFKKANKIKFRRFSGQTLPILKDKNVISLAGRPPEFVPKEIVNHIVRFYSNAVTDQIYNEMFHIATQVVKHGTVPEAYQKTKTALTPDQLRALADEMDALKARAMEAETKLTKTQTNAVTNVLKFGVTSKQILDQYPEQSKTIIDNVRPQVQNPERYGPTGLLSIGLNNLGLPKQSWRAAKGNKILMFDSGAVAEIMSKVSSKVAE